MERRVGFAAGVLASNFGEFDPLALPFTARFVIVTGDLQSKFQQQFLHRLQYDSRDALRLRRNFR